MHRTLLQDLAMFASDRQDEWDEFVLLFLYSDRTASHQVTSYISATMLFGRDLRMPCDMVSSQPPGVPVEPAAYMGGLTARLEQIHSFTRENLSEAFNPMTACYGQHVTAKAHVPGDEVRLYYPTHKNVRSPKLQRNWDGPLTVVVASTMLYIASGALLALCDSSFIGAVLLSTAVDLPSHGLVLNLLPFLRGIMLRST